MAFTFRSAAGSDGRAATKPGRLLLLSTDMGMGGGAEEQVIELAYSFHARGWATLIVSMLPPSPMPPGFSRRGIPLAHLGMRRGIPDPRSLYRLARIIRQFRPDVVHSHMNHANLLARAVRLIQPYPVLICTLHAQTMAGVEHDRSTVFEMAHRVTDALADRTTAISRSAADYYVRRHAVSASKMMFMPNGIESERFAAAAGMRERMRHDLGVDGQFVWLAVGRLELAKAYPTLLRAFSRLDSEGSAPAERNPIRETDIGHGELRSANSARPTCIPKNRVLLICGRGSLQGSLLALAEELGIAERVRFLGLRSDIPEVMSAADAFALSSDVEGLPLVLLQASAAALPIVATDVGGNPEAVAPGVNGDLVPTGDPVAFARAMARMESLSPADRSALGHAGRARVKALFESERVMGNWEQLYVDLLDRARGSPNRRQRGGEPRALIGKPTPLFRPAAKTNSVRAGNHAS